MGNELACKLTTPEFQKRKATIIAGLRSRLTGTEEITNGFNFAMAATDEAIEAVSHFVKTERQCCEFFSYRVSIPSGSPNLHLELTGPPGAKEFIRNELGL